MNKGIAIAGTIVIDNIKIIDNYPQSGELAKILNVSSSVGGCVPNTAIDLKKLDPELKVYAYGKIGRDQNGSYVNSVLEKFNVDVTGIVQVDNCLTAASDVMTCKENGVRTFFYNGTSNETLSYYDLKSKIMENIEQIKMFHIGYINQLDELLAEDYEFGTILASLLAFIHRKGIITSIDLASFRGDPDLINKIETCIPHCDFMVINELEAGLLSQVTIRDPINQKLNLENMRTAAQVIVNMGLQAAIIVHAPEGAYYLSREMAVYVPSLHLPNNYIKGTVGAGDAFCAGVLYGLFQDFPPEKCLQLGAACGAANLSKSNAIDGMMSIQDVMKLSIKYQ